MCDASKAEFARGARASHLPPPFPPPIDATTVKRAGEPLLPPSADPTVLSAQEGQQQQQQSFLATLRRVSRCSKLILAGSGALMAGK